MGPRTRNGTNSSSSEVLVPAVFDVTQSFTCGFCAENFQKQQPKSYASAVEHTLKNEKSTPGALFSEIAQEQTRKESKKFNLVIKGTKPSDLTTDQAIVQDLAKALSVPVSSNEVST